MRANGILTTATALFLCAGGNSVFAQAGRPWVDPPTDTVAPPQAEQAPPRPAAPTSAPPAGQAVQPQTVAPEPSPSWQATEPMAPPLPSPTAPTVAEEPRRPLPERRLSRSEIARDFAVDYLDAWSSPNDEALDSMAEFYGPDILFHGRRLSMRALYQEKRRFAQRWPQRDYRVRPESIGVDCKPRTDICTVRAVFDYSASHPKRRRRAEGTGALQLIVHFIGDKPVIVAEHSSTIRRTSRRDADREDSSHG